MRRRRRAALDIAVAGLLVVSVLVAWRSWTEQSGGCGGDETVVQHPAPVLGPVEDAHDARLTKLAGRVAADGFGPVVAGVGYDYGQWFSAGSVATGLAVWTKHDPVVSFLDNDLKPRWGLRQAKVPHAWTSDAETFYQLELSSKHRMRITAYGLTDGHRKWCATVGDRPTRDQDPYGTALVGPDRMVVLARGEKGLQLTSLDTASGKAGWTRAISGIDRGDYLGDLGNGLVLVGGRATYEMGDAHYPAPTDSALVAVDERTGRVRWHLGGGEVHVVGRSGGLVVVQELGANGLELVALDTDGKQRWRRPAKRFGYDIAATGDMLVANTGEAFVGIDPATGRRKWRTPYRSVPQYLPYGFVLAAQPMLDARNILLAGTDALHALDTRTGRLWDYPLPKEGVSTTYWPYQVLVSDHLLTVVTNTGAVVVDRGLA